MSNALEVGSTMSREITVDADRTIDFMGEACRVYATPSLVRDIEHLCRDLILKHVPEGHDSVGTVVNIVHTAPTLIDSPVTITATVAALDGRKVAFDIGASDPLDEICKGRHERVVVDVDKTRDRLAQKAARMKGS